MGHCSVLVIGENSLDMFDKFQRAEYANSTKNKYFAAVDILKEARARYDRDTTRFLQDKDGRLYDPWDAQFWRSVENDEPAPVPTDYPVVTNLTASKRLYVPTDFQQVHIPTRELVTFQDWICKYYGLALLDDGQEPDLLKTHREGWIRVNESGNVIEAMQWTIPNGVWDYFEGTINLFKLKPGVTGLSIRGEERVVDDYAGCARKGAIDFEWMRHEEGQKAAELWDKAATARGSLTWERYTALYEKYNEQPGYSSLAWKEYRQQPAIEAMYAAGCSPYNQGACLDSFGMTRDEYIQLHRDKTIFQHFGYVVKDEKIIDDSMDIRLSLADLNRILEELPDDTLLTAASVHA